MAVCVPALSSVWWRSSGTRARPFVSGISEGRADAWSHSDHGFLIPRGDRAGQAETLVISEDALHSTTGQEVGCSSRPGALRNPCKSNITAVCRLDTS